jgi:hypothetical protein
LVRCGTVVQIILAGFNLNIDFNSKETIIG